MPGQHQVAKLGMFVAVVVLCLSVQAQTLPTATEKQSSGQSPSSEGPAQTAPEGSQASSDAAQADEGKGGKWHVRLGTVTFAASYVHLPANYFDPFFPYSAGYGPYFYDPFYWPAYATPAPSPAFSPGRGKVELAVDRKNADVYLDSFYVGTAGRLKTMWLVPGAYNLSVTGPDGAAFHQRIYVLSGKSMKVKARLERQAAQATPQEKQP